VVRRRVEGRDVPGLARDAARAPNPTLVLTRYLSSATRALLLAAGLGAWDVAGNVAVDLPGIGLHLVEENGPPESSSGKGGVRSLSGETAGRVARALIDLAPPYPGARLAEAAWADRGYVSRMIGFLADAGLVERGPRGQVARVDWPALLAQWAEQAPLGSRGTRFPFRCPGGTDGFLVALARSGLLHALTGASAFAHLRGVVRAVPALLYVDDLEAAIAQLKLRPADKSADVILLEPHDRSVFHRSREAHGLRCVSPSLMAADLESRDARAEAVHWMAQHERTWRSG
jgi:hypothetical protein